MLFIFCSTPWLFIYCVKNKNYYMLLWEVAIWTMGSPPVYGLVLFFGSALGSQLMFRDSIIVVSTTLSYRVFCPNSRLPLMLDYFWWEQDDHSTFQERCSENHSPQVLSPTSSKRRGDLVRVLWEDQPSDAVTLL